MTHHEWIRIRAGDKIVDNLGKYGSGLVHEVIGVASRLGCSTPSLEIFNPRSKCNLALYPPIWSIVTEPKQEW